MSEARDRVLEVLARVARVDVSELTADKDLAADLGLDSAKGLELLVEIEERMGLEIPEEAPPRFKTVGDLVGYLEKMNAREAPA